MAGENEPAAFPEPEPRTVLERESGRRGLSRGEGGKEIEKVMLRSLGTETQGEGRNRDTSDATDSDGELEASVLCLRGHSAPPLSNCP